MVFLHPHHALSWPPLLILPPPTYGLQSTVLGLLLLSTHALALSARRQQPSFSHLLYADVS